MIAALVRLKIAFGKFILGQGAQTWNFPGAHLDGFKDPSGSLGLGLVDPQDFPKGDLLSCHRQKKKKSCRTAS